MLEDVVLLACTPPLMVDAGLNHEAVQVELVTFARKAKLIQTIKLKQTLTKIKI